MILSDSRYGTLAGIGSSRTDLWTGCGIVIRASVANCGYRSKSSMNLVRHSSTSMVDARVER